MECLYKYCLNCSVMSSETDARVVAGVSSEKRVLFTISLVIHYTYLQAKQPLFVFRHVIRLVLYLYEILVCFL